MPPKNPKTEDENELEDVEKLFDQTKGQLLELREKMAEARKRREGRLEEKRQEEENLAEAIRRSRREVPGASSSGDFSSSSRGPLERAREPKAGAKKEEKKEERKLEKKEEKKMEKKEEKTKEARPERARTPPGQRREHPSTESASEAAAATPKAKEEKKKDEAGQEEENKRVLATTAPKWKAERETGGGKPTMLPGPKLFWSPALWAGMRFGERVAHQEAVRDKKPKGTVGEALLTKQGE
ncbi:unnamed protein product, partial [Symbiodinium sp. CCMP2592]